MSSYRFNNWIMIYIRWQKLCKDYDDYYNKIHIYDMVSKKEKQESLDKTRELIIQFSNYNKLNFLVPGRKIVE